jgi:hypothetical protein
MESDQIRFNCEDEQQIISYLNGLMPSVDRKYRKTLNRMTIWCLQNGGVSTVVTEFYGKTVADVIERYSSIHENVVVSGELDGVKFRLTE